LEVHPKDAMYYLDCGHGFCAASLFRTYDCYQSDPVCPEPACRKRVGIKDLKALVGPETMARVARFRLSSKFGNDSSLQLCPNKTCTQVLRSSSTEKCEVFCKSCDELVMVEARTEEDQAVAQLLVSLGMRICSNCGNGIERKGGCDKVMCRCGAKFCYRCGKENAKCGCTSHAHIFWDNVNNSPELPSFSFGAFPRGRLRFSGLRRGHRSEACCTIS